MKDIEIRYVGEYLVINDAFMEKEEAIQALHKLIGYASEISAYIKDK